MPRGVIGRSLVRRFLVAEDGAVTALGLFLFVICVAIAGLAVDFASALKTRTHLQVAADSAAHAALVARQTMPEAEAVQVGLAVAYATLPADSHGEFIRASDFMFGTWDRDARLFTEVAGSREAVMVDTGLIAARANQFNTMMLRVIDVDEWDIVRRSIYETYVPRCLIEGFVSDVLVDMTSNSIYRDGFCLHSNDMMELQNGNTFETGAMASVSALDQLILPSSGMVNNPGLPEAIRIGYYDIRVTERIDYMIENAIDPMSDVYPAQYLTAPAIIDVTPSNNFDAADWNEGRINRAICPSMNNRLRIRAGTVLRNGILITNCELVLGQGVVLEDMIVLSTNTNEDAISGAADVRIGAPDICAPGGDVQLITRGGVSFPSQLSIFGSRIIAELEVSFTANAFAVQGASILSNGPIIGTANGLADTCGIEGMPYSGQWDRYFRIAS